MQDLISRQQAIVTAVNAAINWHKLANPQYSIAYCIGEAMRQLPPIQPEITHEQAVAYLQSTGWMQEHDRQMMLDGVHRLTVQPEPHWIPVTERLPAMGKSVLICDAYGDICLGHRTQCGCYYPDFCDDKIKDVRAWCELPEPFNGVTEWKN